eukprot:5421580-Ditylum_brightwellii.AAC.1
MKFNKDKDTNDDDLDEIHRVVLNSVQSNIAEFVQVNKYGAIHVDLIEDNKIIKSGTIVSKANKLWWARTDLSWILEPKDGPLPTIVKLHHMLVADLDVKV